MNEINKLKQIKTDLEGDKANIFIENWKKDIERKLPYLYKGRAKKGNKTMKKARKDLLKRLNNPKEVKKIIKKRKEKLNEAIKSLEEENDRDTQLE